MYNLTKYTKQWTEAVPNLRLQSLLLYICKCCTISSTTVQSHYKNLPRPLTYSRMCILHLTRAPWSRKIWHRGIFNANLLCIDYVTVWGDIEELKNNGGDAERARKELELKKNSDIGRHGNKVGLWQHNLLRYDSCWMYCDIRWYGIVVFIRTRLVVCTIMTRESHGIWEHEK